MSPPYVAGGNPEVTASLARLLPLSTFFKSESSFWRAAIGAANCRVPAFEIAARE